MKSREVIEAARAELAAHGIRDVGLVPGGKHQRITWVFRGQRFWVPCANGTRTSPTAAKNARRQIRKLLERVT
jgi:hypothetical protein